MMYKSASGVLDYVRDWSDWLATSDTIQTSAWAVDTGITIDSDANDTTTATVQISSGTTGKTYKVSNTITTVGGDTEVKVFYLRIQEQQC